MAKKVKIKLITIILAVIFSFSICIIPTSAKTAEVIIGGETFGLKLYCKGVMVIRLEKFRSRGNTVCPAKDSGIKVNDVITEADSTKIKSNEQLSEIIKNSKGKAVTLTVLRNDIEILKKIKAEKNENGDYYSGMWIRDSCAGLGTISYYNPDNMTYGALGHGICDIESGGLMQSDSGEILKAKITSVTKSTNHGIGTLNGYFTDEKIGTISKNSPLGIYGKLTSIPKKPKIHVASANEIRAGKAYIYSTIKGQTSKKYSVKIVDICNTDTNSNRNLIVKITDKKLIKGANGIVQGMSGSPIVQNNKLVGALTHVFLDDSSMGYAVLGENMVKN